MVIETEIIKKIQSGGVGVMPTDTIYGLVGSVFNAKILSRIHAVKGRDASKRYIVLVGSTAQLPELGIHLNQAQLQVAKNLWKDPVSIDLKSDNTLPHLTGEYGSIAVRLPAQEWLRDCVLQTGPIIATSANKSGLPTPSDISEIREQLPGLDFYLEGPTGTKPSRLARISRDGSIEWLERS